MDDLRKTLFFTSIVSFCVFALTFNLSVGVIIILIESGTIDDTPLIDQLRFWPVVGLLCLAVVFSAMLFPVRSIMFFSNEAKVTHGASSSAAGL